MSSHYILAFAGTDDTPLLEGDDWATNFGNAFELYTDQYGEAVRIAVALREQFQRGDVVVAGHSLGGGLASVAAVAGAWHADTFNASNASRLTLAQHDGNRNIVYDNDGNPLEVSSGAFWRFDRAEHLVDAYYVDYEILTYVLALPGVRDRIGAPHELDGWADYPMDALRPGFPVTLTAALPIMVQLHLDLSVLYGLLVREGLDGYDALGYQLP